MRPIDGDDLKRRFRWWAQHDGDARLYALPSERELFDRFVDSAPTLDIDEKRAFDAGYEAGKRDAVIDAQPTAGEWISVKEWEVTHWMFLPELPEVEGWEGGRTI